MLRRTPAGKLTGRVEQRLRGVAGRGCTLQVLLDKALAAATTGRYAKAVLQRFKRIVTPIDGFIELAVRDGFA